MGSSFKFLYAWELLARMSKQILYIIGRDKLPQIRNK